jgi:uncharacterized protein (DUF433 family)
MTTLIQAPITDHEGVLRVTGSRVTVDTILECFHDGATPEEIALRYPSLELAAVYEVIAYYLRHRAELDAYLEQSRAVSDKLRAEIETRSNPVGIRARLLERKG